MAASRVELLELRVLDGPNRYFPRPAVKLTLAAPGLLSLPDDRAERLLARTRSNGQPGGPGSEQRRRAIARLAVTLTRRLARASGVRLAVRARAEPDGIVVAFPWRRRGAAEALGLEVASVLDDVGDARRAPDRLIASAADRLAGVEPGPEPSVPDPAIPVISVTGTNGKTTVVRLLAHLVRAAGRRVAYSSTDGVYRGDGELVEAGDYSGFGGAAMALAQGPEVAVLETARGGILLRGIGVLHNDVAVVTNVSEDHLGLQGIRTLDQLAELKASITRITRPDGWDVLNADDPRVLAMRRDISGRPWMCSLDPQHPALRETLTEGGRATTVLDGRLAVLEGAGARALVPLVDVPVTIAGISRPNVMNALQAASAALGIGLPERAVIRGLRSFVLDPERNPGRTNLFALGGRTVVIDYAHNESGMLGLTEICEGLRRKRSEIWLAICAAGDRTDRILHAFAERAARGSDHLAVAELLRYLRGRDRLDVVERLRAGAADGGADEIDVYADELSALRGMLARSRRGDVVAVTALGMRADVFAWLETAGAEGLSPGRVRRLVTTARASKAPGAPDRR
ncbi:MAG TPA: Mur ligase family protein [Actinomycetota bacterium]|jgi:cyanophycin synthetase|nr:Mur ligase family protein [Actinomycetota bacterium]